MLYGDIVQIVGVSFYPMKNGAEKTNSNQCRNLQKRYIDIEYDPSFLQSARIERQIILRLPEIAKQRLIKAEFVPCNC